MREGNSQETSAYHGGTKQSRPVKENLVLSSYLTGDSYPLLRRHSGMGGWMDGKDLTAF